MEEMLQLFAQPGVFDRQAEGVNNHQSDHSGHPTWMRLPGMEVMGTMRLP